MTRAGRTRLGDAGESLLEIVIAVMILGIGTAAVLGAMGLSITTARDHREQSVAGRVLDNFAEYLKDESTSPYVPCAQGSPSTGTVYDSYKAAFLTLASTSAASNPVFEPTISQYTLSIRVDAGTPNPVLGADPATTFPSLTASPICSAGSSPYDTAVTDDRIQRLTLTVTRPGGDVGAAVQITKWRRS